MTLSLQASSAAERLPFYRRRAFWIKNTLLLAWSAVFLGIVSVQGMELWYLFTYCEQEQWCCMPGRQRS